MIRDKAKFIIKYPMTFVFSLMVIVMLVLFVVLPENDFSPMENRYLAHKPKLTVEGLLDGTYMSSFDTYCAEQIPFRNTLVKIKALCETTVFGNENDGISKGKDGYLFEKVTSTSDQLHKNIAAIANFVKLADRTVYIAIAPNVETICSEKVPRGMPVLDEKAAMAELSKTLSGYNNAIIVNLYAALKPHFDEQLYYRTDHHWNDCGARYAYKAILKRMGYDEYEISSLQKHTVSDFYGTKYAKYKGIVKPDTIEYVDVPVISYDDGKDEHKNLIDESKADTYDKYSMLMYGNPGYATVHSDIAHNGKSLILFKDSYANSVIPYLACTYDEIIIMDLRYYGGSVLDVMDKNQDADILFLYNWSFVNDDNHFYKVVK